MAENKYSFLIFNRAMSLNQGKDWDANIFTMKSVMVFSHQSKTTTRQRQDKSWTCAFLWCLSHQTCRTWCERHNRNAPVQLLSCRCLALVWKHHKSVVDRRPLLLYTHNPRSQNNLDRPSIYSKWRQGKMIHHLELIWSAMALRITATVKSTSSFVIHIGGWRRNACNAGTEAVKRQCKNRDMIRCYNYHSTPCSHVKVIILLVWGQLFLKTCILL